MSAALAANLIFAGTRRRLAWLQNPAHLLNSLHPHAPSLMKDDIVWIYLTDLAVKPYSMISSETSDGAATRLPFRFQIRKGFMSLGAEIKKLRIKKGESLQDVANAVKASKAHIWDIERGASKNPTMDLLGRIAAHFGVSIASLVGEEPPKGMQSELVALYRDLKDLSASDRDTIRALAKRLSERKKEL